MAATYGYGGEFSSDEDIDRVEQNAERMVQERFNDNYSARPSAKQIDEIIDAIKNSSPDENIDLTDEVLAGLLDHFKTQRGPIVDSTRKLYKKIVMRMIREGPKQPDNENNGNSDHISNNNNFNEKEFIANKEEVTVIDSFSSDEEEPIAPNANFEKRSNVVVPNNNNNEKSDEDANSDKMEIDSETPLGPVRESKQVDISTDDDDDHDSDSSEESSAGLDSESDVLNVTPIKSHQQQRQQSTIINNDKLKTTTTALSTPKRSQTESSAKRQPLAQSTPKETVKKPYTRSQRLAAARAATSKEKASDSFIDNKSAATSSNDGRRASRRVYLLLVATISIVLVAFLVYKFRSNIVKSSTASGSQLFGNKINFV